MSDGKATCDIGFIGLGVMGQNLALNFTDHDYAVAGFDVDHHAVAAFAERYMTEVEGERPGAVVGCTSAVELVQALRTPRVIVLLVPAGPIVDRVCESLIGAGIEATDIVVDAGNSRWTDTIRRAKQYEGQLTFFGSGTSGGEVGARFGPSLMPGGNRDAWARLEPMWKAVAAKVDPDTGKPIDGAAPGQPINHGDPCAAYIGENGAGHYVKMVHNGIEYADMQLIAEAYFIMRHALGMPPRDIGDVFAQWNAGDLDSYLIEITADILRQDDPVTGQPFIDVVMDRAGQKGTGRWTAEQALSLGAPAATIAEAVFARAVSYRKDERIAAAKVLTGPTSQPRRPTDDHIHAIRDALYCSKICAYAQGFQLLHAAVEANDWDLHPGEIASIWRGGCIIRARFLQKITDAYTRAPKLANLLIDPYFAGQINAQQAGWREVVSLAALRGLPCPAFAASLAYYDGYRTERLSASVIQAQRDYFGAHTYERVDQPRGRFFHLEWEESGRPQVEVS